MRTPSGTLDATTSATRTTDPVTSGDPAAGGVATATGTPAGDPGDPAGTRRSTGTPAPETPVPTQPDEFDFLVVETQDPDYDLIPPVNIAEARQARRVFTIGNYLLAGVPASISALNTLLKTNGATALTLINKQNLLNTHGQKIDSVLRLIAEDFNTEEDVLKEVRREFDLGTTPVVGVNAEFKTIYKEFVMYCADDLLGVDPTAAASRVSFDDRQAEELHNFLRKTKRSLLRLTQSLSESGTLGTDSLVLKWARIIQDSLQMLNTIGAANVASDDADQKHVWHVAASLNNRQKAEIEAYVVQAREGGLLLQDIIDIYQVIQAQSKLPDETQQYLRDLFHQPGAVFPNQTVSERLKRNASHILEHWIPAWS